MIFLNRIGDENCADFVQFPMPSFAGEIATQLEGLIDFGVGVGFVFAFIPSKTSEGPGVRAELLLDIEAESVFGGCAPGMLSDRRPRRLTRQEIADGVA